MENAKEIRRGWKFEKEFRDEHPETIGEADLTFDLDNYRSWLENNLEEYASQPRGEVSEEMTEFLKFIKEQRNDFVKVAGTYDVSNHLKLRTEIDSLLIAYDQMEERLSHPTKVDALIAKYNIELEEISLSRICDTKAGDDSKYEMLERFIQDLNNVSSPSDENIGEKILLKHTASSEFEQIQFLSWTTAEIINAINTYFKNQSTPKPKTKKCKGCGCDIPIGYFGSCYGCDP